VLHRSIHSAGTWPDPVIFKKIILPWEVRHPKLKTGTP
jgi:hypothetical protein